MKFALVDGNRAEASPGLQGVCPGCTRPMIAKCGEVKVHHWAHLGKRVCDPWWENETEWHRTWKAHFPIEWQEQIHHAEDGEKHIADVKTEKGCVLEFQYSHLNPVERRSRNAFYKNLYWVVNGSRRPRYKTQFSKALESGTSISKQPLVQAVFLGESALVREWYDTGLPVFFDFEEIPNLWCLIPTNDDMWGYLSPIPREAFIEFHRGNGTFDLIQYLGHLSKIVLSHTTMHHSPPATQQFYRPSAFQLHMARRNRFRRFRRL